MDSEAQEPEDLQTEHQHHSWVNTIRDQVLLPVRGGSSVGQERFGECAGFEMIVEGVMNRVE